MDKHGRCPRCLVQLPMAVFRAMQIRAELIAKRSRPYRIVKRKWLGMRKTVWETTTLQEALKLCRSSNGMRVYKFCPTTLQYRPVTVKTGEDYLIAVPPLAAGSESPSSDT